MICKVDHFVITTNDMDRCLDFYEKIGFFVERGDTRAMVFAGDFKINIHYLGQELEPHANHVQVGSGDFCFEIEGSLEAFQQFLVTKEIFPEVGIVPRTGAFGQMRSIYLRDPDGNLLEFSSYASEAH